MDNTSYKISRCASGHGGFFCLRCEYATKQTIIRFAADKNHDNMSLCRIISTQKQAVATAAAFLFPSKALVMNRHELIAIVKSSTSTTLMANRFRAALGLPQRFRADAGRGGHSGAGKSTVKHVKHQRYRHSRKLMAQKFGVRQ